MAPGALTGETAFASGTVIIQYPG